MSAITSWFFRDLPKKKEIHHHNPGPAFFSQRFHEMLTSIVYITNTQRSPSRQFFDPPMVPIAHWTHYMTSTQTMHCVFLGISRKKVIKKEVPQISGTFAACSMFLPQNVIHNPISWSLGHPSTLSNLMIPVVCVSQLAPPRFCWKDWEVGWFHFFRAWLPQNDGGDFFGSTAREVVFLTHKKCH